MSGSNPQLASLTSDDGRRQERTHLFVAAQLCFASGTCPVHIRNMSPSGALIEGASLPDQHEPATLRRGPLEAKVRVVWKAGRKAGVSFLSAVHVADWMSRTMPSHQAKVDDLVRGIRAGQVGNAEAVQGMAGKEGPPIEGDLRELRRELGVLEHALAGDEAVIMAHPEIQMLDIALQRIDRMIARVRGA
jgi:hypothetical protein